MTVTARGIKCHDHIGIRPGEYAHDRRYDRLERGAGK
jgi:hypothetical protein